MPGDDKLTPTSSTGGSASATISFTGQSNTSYGFYATATDAAGNTTPYSPFLEAYTYLPDLTPPVTSVNPTGGTAASTVDPSTGTFTLNLSGTAPGGKPLTYFEVYVSIDAGSTGGSTKQVGAAIPAGFPDANGVYHATVTYQGLTDGISHSYKFWSIGIDGAGLTQAAPANPVSFLSQSFTAASLEVTGLTVEYGAAERSYIRYLDVNFNESDGQSNGQLTSLAGSVADSPATSVQLIKYNLQGASGAAVALTGVTASVIDHAIELDFGPKGLGGNPITTAGDGYYELDVTTGGTTYKHEFYRLMGDVNGDGIVDNNDASAITSEFTLASPSGFAPLSADVNVDGTVTQLDATFMTRAKGDKVNPKLKLG